MATDTGAATWRRGARFATPSVGYVVAVNGDNERGVVPGSGGLLEVYDRDQCGGTTPGETLVLRDRRNHFGSEADDALARIEEVSGSTWGLRDLWQSRRGAAAVRHGLDRLELRRPVRRALPEFETVGHTHDRAAELASGTEGQAAVSASQSVG